MRVPENRISNSGAAEDFTLLNLSQHSSLSESSDDLFTNHHSAIMPPKKKKLRLKKRNGYSVRERSRSGERMSSDRRGSTLFFSTNVIYAFILLLLSWSATLSWLLFSLRNQLTTFDTSLNSYESFSKVVPMSIESINSSLLELSKNFTLLSHSLQLVQTSILANDKNISETNGFLKELKGNLATLGSNFAELKSNVDKMNSDLSSFNKLLETESKKVKNNTKSTESQIT